MMTMKNWGWKGTNVVGPSHPPTTSFESHTDNNQVLASTIEWDTSHKRYAFVDHSHDAIYHFRGNVEDLLPSTHNQVSPTNSARIPPSPTGPRLIELPTELLLKIYDEAYTCSIACLAVTAKRFYAIYRRFYVPIRLIESIQEGNGRPIFLYQLMDEWIGEGRVFNWTIGKYHMSKDIPTLTPPETRLQKRWEGSASRSPHITDSFSMDGAMPEPFYPTDQDSMDVDDERID
ncbi:hypothetical protein B0O99DRAFT_114493 [Bisporella sp. PMI_857]|nr:hypothetical protein B0O99DRAFT_114493 [Bisporella sp. PMI_857]